MTHTEMAWAAGLFEGEGCFSVSRYVRPSGKVAAYPQALLTSTDEDVVRRFHEAIGIGQVLGPYDKGKGHKPFWRWQVASKRGFARAAELLEPHLGTRRRARLQEVRSETEV